MSADIIFQQFPDLSLRQKQQFEALKDLYEDWNSKINLISRKDIQNLYSHHILGSLAIAKLLSFRAETTVLDVGTGGGFPGVPLAIMFPQVKFHLIDSVGKKIKVVNDVVAKVELENVTTEQVRLEEHKQKYQFVVSRAVMPMPDLVRMARKNICKDIQQNPLPNGIIALKGGTLGQELKPFGKSVEVIPVNNYFTDSYYAEKYIIYLPI